MELTASYMISVPNRLLLSNGNKLILLLLCCVLFACKTTSYTTKSNPSDGTPPVQTPQIDTVEWMTIESLDTTNIHVDPVDFLPINTDAHSSHLAIILPLNLSELMIGEGMTPNDESLLHYYMGIKLGLESVAFDGFKLNVKFFDSESDANKIERILDEIKTDNTPYIFGGRGKNIIAKIADFADENNTDYVSAWQANSKFIGQNLNYYQLNPGFHAHALAILKHALKEFNSEQIILFGSKKEENRVNEINRLYTEMTGAVDQLETFVVEDMNELEQLEMEEWKEKLDKKVFIVPITRDYNLIHDFFRFIDYNELHEKSIIYGMTEWNSEKLKSHLEHLDVRLTSFWNPDVMTNFSSFENSFYAAMGCPPTEMAYEGYGHIQLMCELIQKKQANHTPFSEASGHGVKAEFVDHAYLESPVPDQATETSFYENRHVFLLKFEQSRYHIIE